MENDPHQQLFLDILQHPDDDSKRLAYADWLFANSQQKRAEFIRAQCILHSPSQRATHTNAEVEHLQAQSSAYELASREEVKKVFRLWRPKSWVFRRGFIERFDGCTLTDGADGNHVLQLFQMAPILYLRDTEQLTNIKSLCQAMSKMPPLRGLELNNVYSVDDALMDVILQSPKFAQLEILLIHHDKSGSLIDEDVLVRALMSPHRANLRVLGVNVDFSWQGPSDDIVSAIAESPYLRKLQKLYLTNMVEAEAIQLTMSTVKKIAGSENFRNLKELDLRGSCFMPHVWRALVSVLQSFDLQKIYMYDCRTQLAEEAGLTWLSEAEQWRQLMLGSFGDAVDFNTRLHCEGDVYWKNRIEAE